MNYHNITHADMKNGDGLRVVLWLSGCSHNCRNCQNPQTWNPKSGITFDLKAKNEIYDELKNDYISGITFSGGDPLYETNLDEVLELINSIREKFPDSSIWIYTGYSLEEIMKNTDNISDKRKDIVLKCDVLVDGKYINELRDISLEWRGSSNQRVIDMQETIRKGEIVLWA